MTAMTLNTVIPSAETIIIPPPDPRKEYVAGGGQLYASYATALHALPHPIDDISSELRTDIYQQMMLDSQCNASTNIFRASIVEDGARLLPAISDPKAPGYKKAQKILEFCQNQLDNMEVSFREVLFAMSEALAVGNVVAELVWEQAGPDLALRSIKPKPRESTAFVVDPYYNIVGLLAQIPGVSYTTSLQTFITADPKDLPLNLMPREKFAILSWRPKYGDPRGTSVLRPAYDAWWRKRQIEAEHLKYLSQFASPSLIGILQPGAQRVALKDATGAPTGQYIEPSEAMAQQLMNFKNGTFIVVSNGADVKPLYVTGDGASFLHALASYNREIVRAILTQTLATEEGEHSSRAQASVHQDALDTIIRQGKAGMEEMIRKDILKKIVRYNFGESFLPLTPQASLGQLEAPDAAKIWASLAQLASSGYLDPSQYTDLDSAVGLPARADSSAVAQPPAQPQPAAPSVQQTPTPMQMP